VYDVSLTWTTQHLDAIITNNVRRWLALPVSSCIGEILALLKSKGGFNVTSLKSLTEKLRMTQRHSGQVKKRIYYMRSLWQVSAADYRSIDSISAAAPNISAAIHGLNKLYTDKAYSHVTSLRVQGALINITESQSHIVRNIEVVYNNI